MCRGELYSTRYLWCPSGGSERWIWASICARFGGFAVLVAVGFVLAVALAVLTMVRVDRERLRVSYRDSEQWSSTAQVFVTQEGFPLGRSIYDEVIPVGPEGG